MNPTGEYVAGLVTLSVARSTDTFTAKTGDLTLYYNLSSLVVAATERRLVVGGEGGSIAIHESCSGEVYQTVAGTSNNTRVNTYGKATKETRDGLDYAVVAGTMVVNNGYVKSLLYMVVVLVVYLPVPTTLGKYRPVELGLLHVPEPVFVCFFDVSIQGRV